MTVFLADRDGTLNHSQRYPAGNGANSILSAISTAMAILTSPSPAATATTVDPGVGGDGTFDAGPRYEVGDGPNWATLVDVNEDGNLDLAVANSSTDTSTSCSAAAMGRLTSNDAFLGGWWFGGRGSGPRWTAFPDTVELLPVRGPRRL